MEVISDEALLYSSIASAHILYAMTNDELTVTNNAPNFFLPLLYHSSPAVKTTQHGLVNVHRVLKYMRWCIRSCSELILCFLLMGKCSKVKF